MAYPGHAYVSLDGDWTTSDASDEVWQFGIRVRGNTGAPDNGFLQGPQAYCDAIATGIGTWFSNSGHQMANTARLRMLKVNNIGPDGKYRDPTTHQHDYGSGIVGANGINGSGILSTAYSFQGSDISRGPGARGRCYPPNVSILAGASFTTSTAQANVHLAAALALLEILTIDEPTGGALVRPFIVSKGTPASGGVGRSQTISRVSVDTVIDVQRRRKNRVTGTRVGADR